MATSDDIPRIDGTDFVWRCDNGHVTDTPIAGLSRSAVENETTVAVCHRQDCDRVFEVSGDFEDLLTEIADRVIDS